MVNVYILGNNIPYMDPMGYKTYRYATCCPSVFPRLRLDLNPHEDMKPVLRELQRLNPFRGASASGVVVPRAVLFCLV